MCFYCRGDRWPHIGFGTWRIPQDETAAVVCAAAKAGFCLFDTAYAYENEEQVGIGLKQSGIKRDDLLISGKLWNEFRSKKAAKEACKKSLRNLGIDYFDAFLIHWPASAAVHNDWEQINAETWGAMEELQAEGLSKAIGVSNFKMHHLQALEKTAEELPAIDQIEYHPGMQQRQTIEYCNRKGIMIQGWSPLGSGKMLRHPLLRELAEKHGVTTAQLCIAWCIQNGVLPIVKTKTIERLQENLQIAKGILSDDEKQAIDTLPFFAGSRLDPDTVTIFG